MYTLRFVIALTGFMHSRFLTRLLPLTCCFILLFCSSPASAGSALQQLLKIPQASLLLDSDDPVSRISYQARVQRIPASTLKILTSWLAIQQWGLDHRFHTDFFLDKANNLWIRGYGDPMLVSEEIELIAKALAASGLNRVADIYTDEGYFQPGIAVAGQNTSDNPYDAPPAPLAANFNTIHVLVSEQGVQSAEPQTPLTETARRLALRMKPGKHRVNIGDARLSGRYFSELLQAKLHQQGIPTDGVIRSARVPTGLPLYYRHRNSSSLETLLKSMLRYSTNFTANQLFLMLGAEKYGAPASMEKSRRAAMEKIASVFVWPGFEIHEGAGLSRGNRISSSQMVELLREFQPWKDLLYSDIQGIQAKTGTLKGISSYTGYLDNGGEITPFALFIEQNVSFEFRKRVARELRNHPHAL